MGLFSWGAWIDTHIVSTVSMVSYKESSNLFSKHDKSQLFIELKQLVLLN